MEEGCTLAAFSANIAIFSLRLKYELFQGKRAIVGFFKLFVVSMAVEFAFLRRESLLQELQSKKNAE